MMLVPVKLGHAIWRFHSRKILLLLCVSLVVYTVIRFFSVRGTHLQPTVRSSLQLDSFVIPIDGEEPAEPAPTLLESLVSMKHCPLCFGTSFCNGILSGDLTLEQTRPVLKGPHKLVYSATWRKTETVLLKTLPASDFGILERYICKAADMQPNCNAVKAASAMQKKRGELLTVGHAREIHKATGRTRSDLPVAICTTHKLLSVLNKLYDEDGNGNITTEEKIMLYTTLTLNSEALVLKFLKNVNQNLPTPRYFGVCGRVVIVEGGLTPLKEFLREPFEIRASLAGQLLQMVDDFLEDDPEWFIMFTDFTYDNLAVNKDGEIVVVDVGDMVILDKATVQLPGEAGELPKEPCNQQCFIQFSQQVFHSGDLEQVCERIPRYSHLMYALVCQQILSNLDDHRVENFFRLELSDDVKKLDHPGLLHSLPDKDKESVEELLRECVLETAEGGRIQAAEELRDFLSEYTNEDVVNDPGDKEEYEEDDKADQ